MPPAEPQPTISPSELPPHFWVFAYDAMWVVGALAGGWLAGWLVSRWTSSSGINWVISRPWDAPEGKRPRERKAGYDTPRNAGHEPASRPAWLPSEALGWLTILTVWCVSLWGVAQHHHWTELSQIALAVPSLLWVVACVLLVSLGVARTLSGLVCEALATPAARAWIDRHTDGSTDAGSLTDPLARLATALIYSLLCLLGLVALADQLAWANLAIAAGAMWDLALRLLGAVLALGVGWWGWRWALTPPEHNPALPDGRSIHGIIAGGCTLLAILILAGNFSTTITLIVLSLIVLLIWPLRGRLLEAGRNILGYGNNQRANPSSTPNEPTLPS